MVLIIFVKVSLKRQERAFQSHRKSKNFRGGGGWLSIYDLAPHSLTRSAVPDIHCEILIWRTAILKVNGYVPEEYWKPRKPLLVLMKHSLFLKEKYSARMQFSGHQCVADQGDWGLG